MWKQEPIVALITFGEKTSAHSGERTTVPTSAASAVVLVDSIIPSVIFLFSGIMSRSILLIIASVLFTPTHILISYKNAKY